MPQLQFNCMALTWNLAGTKPEEFNDDILQYFASHIADEGEKPDIIIIGLQEAKHLIKKDKTGGYVSGRIVKSLHYPIRNYKRSKNIARLGSPDIKARCQYYEPGKMGYTKVTREYLRGFAGNNHTYIVLEVFVREDLMRAPASPMSASVSKVKSGTFRDTWINHDKNDKSWKILRSTSHIWKGGCYCVLDIHGQKLGIMNAHLDAYDKKGKEARNYEIERLVKKVKGHHGNIPMIFMGDLNERLAPITSGTKESILQEAEDRNIQNIGLLDPVQRRRNSAQLIQKYDKLSNNEVRSFSKYGFEFKALDHMTYEQRYEPKDVRKAIKKKKSIIPELGTIRLKASERQGPDVGALDNIGFSDDLKRKYNHSIPRFIIGDPEVHTTECLADLGDVSDHYAVSIPFKINVAINDTSSKSVRYNSMFPPFINNPSVKMYIENKQVRYRAEDFDDRTHRKLRNQRYG